MTKNLPLTNGTDAYRTYYLQSSFSVTNEGALIYTGKPFSRNVSIDELDRCRRNQEKYARTMSIPPLFPMMGKESQCSIIRIAL